MQNNEKEIYEQLIAFCVKYISIPALIAIFIKIAVQVKKKQATILGAIVSLLTGLGMAYIAKGFVESNVANSLQPITFAFIGIMADKTAEYFIVKASVDKFFDTIGREIINWVKSKLKK